MKEMDYIGLQACKLQGNLFIASLSETSCSSAIFIRRFMNSSLAKRMDDGNLAFESSTTESMIAEVEAEFGESNYGSNRFGAEPLYWMGYLYRYWSYRFEMSSKHICKIIPARELEKLYAPLHTLDPEQAIERIAEGHGVVIGKGTEDYVRRGVEILREIRKREKFEYC